MGRFFQTYFVNMSTKFLAGFYFLLVLWWLVIFFLGLQDTIQNFLFGLVLSFIPFLGGVLGISLSRKWGFLSSTIGKSLFFLSAGLITWGIGTIIFAYYNLFLDIDVPYPSLADVAYIVSWPLWAIGIINLFHATGAKFQLRKVRGKILFFFIPAIVILVSSYLLFIVARGGEVVSSEGIKLFFDLAYPIGDITILTLAVLLFSLSFNYLGGKYKTPILLILGGFVLNYIADFSFSYTTTIGTFFVANWIDLLFASTMFVLSLGVNLLDPKLRNIKEAQ